MNQSLPMTSSMNVAAKDDWWRGAVIYQIYPRSFRDTNGDGIGDLKGIVEGLDYIAELGVDGIWISPFFTSPMKDFGYDVADYRGVDPSFGTFEDFDAVIAKAHALGLKVIIDQVYSHTSDEHAWFRESRQDRENARADWYVWADPKPDGSPPSNWQSVFGGSAWQWDGPRRQYYLHNFLACQPDLNVHNRDVQDALLDVARFWLDRGVDGFRLDALNFSMHDPQLRDNPPSGVPMDEVTRPFDMQDKVFNQSHADIPAFLERICGVMDEYDARFTVAEVGGPEPLAEMKAFTQGGKRLDSAYNFDFLYAPDLTAERVRKSLANWDQTPGEGWPSWAFSNHDAPRAVTRWANDGDDGVRLAPTAYVFAGSGWAKISEAVQAYLREIGVDMQIQAFDATVAWGKLSTQEFDMFGMSFPYVSSGDALNLYFRSENMPSPNRMNWNDARTDELLLAGATATTDEVRADSYGQVLEIVHDAAVWLPLYHEPMVIAQSTELEEIVPHNIYGAGLYKGLDLKYVD